MSFLHEISPFLESFFPGFPGPFLVSPICPIYAISSYIYHEFKPFVQVRIPVPYGACAKCTPAFFLFVPTIKTAPFCSSNANARSPAIELAKWKPRDAGGGSAARPVAGWYCGRNPRVFWGRIFWGKPSQGNLFLKINFLGGRKPNYPRWLPITKFDVRFGVKTGAPPKKDVDL